MKLSVIERHLFNPGSKELTLALGLTKLLWILRRSLEVFLLRTGTCTWWMNSSCGAEFLYNPQAETSPEKSVSSKFINIPPTGAASELLHQQPVNKGQGLVIYVHTWRKACIFYIILTDDECYCLSYTLPFPSKWCTKTNQFRFNYQSFPFAIFFLLKASFSFTISSWSCLLPHLPLQAPPHSSLFHPLSLPRFSSAEITFQLHPFWPISCRWSISSHAWKSGVPWLLGQSPPIIFYDFSNHFSSPSFCLGPPVQFF